MIREGRTAARINHPSVAVVYDAIEDSGSMTLGVRSAR